VCGLAGVLLNPGQKVEPVDLKAAGAAQRHRGPDDFSIFITENLGIAHNRLSILDLTKSGNQPFVNSRYVLSYNGEIYNFPELRRELLALGVIPEGDSDTTVLFAYLNQFGIESTLRGIRGMFAFAWYDIEQQTVYLCRDRFGIKPLSWMHTARGIYWSSEIKGLRALTPVPLNPVLVVLALLTGDHAAVGGRSLFDGVHEVPAGSFLVCKAGEAPQIKEYYQLAQEIDRDYHRELLAAPPESVLDTFGHLLSRGVRRMLASDAPLGVLVSGGLDSSLIARTAVESSPGLSLFTADVVGENSELEFARQLAEILEAPLKQARFLSDMMLSEWAEISYYYECPVFYHPNAFPLSAVMRLAHAEGFKCLLTGEGADELFLGYPHLHSDASSSQESGAEAPLLREYQSTETVADFMSALGMRLDYASLRSQVRKALDPLSSAEETRGQALSFDLLYGHLPTLLHRNDRIGMRHSVEARFPYLDEEMVHFALNLPLRWKVARVQSLHDERHPFIMDKWVMRQAAQRILPSRLSERKKWGFKVDALTNLRLAASFFRGGFVARWLSLSNADLQNLARTQKPQYLWRLAAIDIFGRLFESNEKAEDITERLLSNVSIIMCT